MVKIYSGKNTVFLFRHTPYGLFIGVLFSLLLASCNAVRSGASEPTAVMVTPTLNPIFASERIPSTEAIKQPQATLRVQPTSVASPTSLASESGLNSLDPGIYQLVDIFDERLNTNWSLDYSHGMEYDLKNTTPVHNGVKSISLTPMRDFGQLFFTVTKGTQETYYRSDVIGVRFWLNSGEGEIATSDIGVSVEGSNRYPYWVLNDQSVEKIQDPLFPEMRLYYLDINSTIPPDTWVQIELWLDNLPYEPKYEYVTGIRIITDKGFENTIYIDQVELVVKQDEQ